MVNSIDLVSGLLKFDKRYSKLYADEFSTLRLDSDLNRGQIVEIRVRGTTLGTATVIDGYRTAIEELKTSFLTYDTETSTRDQAIEELREYYPNLTERTQVDLLYLEWLDRITSLYRDLDREDPRIEDFTREGSGRE